MAQTNGCCPFVHVVDLRCSTSTSIAVLINNVLVMIDIEGPIKL